jgi:PAS domain S-box-containing protein
MNNGLGIPEKNGTEIFIEDVLTWEAEVNATIAELFKALIASVSIEEMSALVLDHVKKLTNSEFGFVGYIDSKTGHLVCPTIAKTTENIWNACQVSDGRFILKEFSGLWGWVLENHQSVLSNIAADDPRSSGAIEATSSIHQIISVPALIQDTLLGQITLANSGRDYQDHELILVERLASVYALAVQRHHHEEDLRASEAHLKAVFDFAGIAIALTDPAGRWIQCNQYWEQMMGYSGDELLTLSNHDITHPDDVAITKECEADLLSGRLQAYRIEKRYRHKRGHPIWVDVSVTPIRGPNHQIFALITAATDITQRRQAEEALQDSLQKLQIAYKQAQIYAEELAQDIRDRKRAESKIQQLNQELEQRVIDRTRELAALYDVTAVASESLPLESMLGQMLERVVLAMRTDKGHIHLLDGTGQALSLAVHTGLSDDVARELSLISVGDGLVGWVFAHRDSLLVPDLAADARTPYIANAQNLAYVGVPMQARGHILGVLSVLGNKENLFNAEEVALLGSVADQVGVAVENARLRQQAEHAAVVEERERLARELHDSVTQLLYSVTLFAGAGQRMARAGKLETPETYLADLGDIAQQALKEMRLLVYELRPPALEQEGLIGALQHRLEAVEGRAGVETRLAVEQWAELPSGIEVELYRITQEALNNALKHATATAVTVRLYSDGERVELEVADNGRGFDPDAAAESGGMGLTGIQERIKRLNGVLTLQSTPGKGTVMVVNVKTGKSRET